MSTIAIGFKNDFENTSIVAVQITQPLQEHEHIWIWDHYFSLVLHRLSNYPESENILQIMSQWATGFANKMYAPVNQLHADNAFTIDTNLRLENVIVDSSEVFFIETQTTINGWPEVRVKIADDAKENRLAFSTIALAQYFLKTNSNFFRELPMHVLAMRKFYRDTAHYRQENSIAEAPAYAFNTALRFYQSLEDKIQQH